MKRRKQVIKVCQDFQCSRHLIRKIYLITNIARKTFLDDQPLPITFKKVKHFESIWVGLLFRWMWGEIVFITLKLYFYLNLKTLGALVMINQWIKNRLKNSISDWLNLCALDFSGRSRYYRAHLYLKFRCDWLIDWLFDWLIDWTAF